MIRSFEYAAAYGLLQGPTRAEDAPALAPWARLWRRWASARFLQGYLGVASGAGFLPPEVRTTSGPCWSSTSSTRRSTSCATSSTIAPIGWASRSQALLRRAEPDGARMAGAST